MSHSGKGLALLLIALAAVGGVGFFLLKGGNDHKIVAPTIAGGGGKAGEQSLPDAVDATNLAQPNAKRDAQPLVSGASAPAAIDPSVPTAEYLVGIVVDENARPVAGAEVSYGPGFLASLGNRGARGAAGRGRGGRGFGRGGRGLPFGRSADEEPLPTTSAKTATDGTFRLPKVARSEGLELRIDHPDFVVLTRNDLVLPASGLDVGRLTLEAGGMVTGFVFGPGGAKLAGAEVVLLDAPDEEPTRRFMNFSFGTRGDRKATSDEEGRFRLTGMPKGKAVVEATASGLCAAVSDAIEVVPLQTAGEVMLHLERGYELKGVVKDGSDKPVGGAEIFAVNNGDWMRMIRSGGQPDYVTGDDGRYSITGLKAIAYDVAASAEGYARASHPNIDPAQVSTLDITLGATLFVAGSVRIKGSSDAPRNVKVQLLPYFGEDNFQFGMIDTDDSENKASEDGRFRIEGLEPGDYRVMARAEGTARGQSTPIKVVEGQSVEDVVIEVERGAMVEGRVLDPTGAPVANAEVRGYEPELPAAADGAATFISRAIRVGGRGRGGMGRFNFDGRRSVGRTKSDGDGRYQLEHLTAGTFDLEVSHADFATLRGSTGEVEVGQKKSGVDFALSRGGSVEGNVVNVDGTPRAGDRIEVTSRVISSVTVSAVSDANGYYRVDHVPAGEAVATREESKGGGGNDMVAVFAMAAGGGNGEDEGKKVLIEEGKSVRVDFSQVEKPIVEGIVTCSDGPVAGAIVSANQGGDGRRPPMIFGGSANQATTGADGRYRLTDLDPGEWSLSVRHPQGLVPTTVSLTLAGGTPTRQDFALDGGVVEGIAVGPDGKTPVNGATVNLERVSGNEGDGEAASTTGAVTMAFNVVGGPIRGNRTMRFGGDDSATRVASSASGAFRIPWVPAGKYRLRLSHPDHLGATSEVLEMATNGHVENVKVSLPAAARLKVTVRSKADGRPLDSHTVQLTNDADGREFGFTDSDGVASFDSLAPGTWNITVHANGRGGRDNGAPQKSVTCEAGLTAETIVDF